MLQSADVKFICSNMLFGAQNCRQCVCYKRNAWEFAGIRRVAFIRTPEKESSLTCTI